jgi:uncharacterized protein YjbI with pentapeptide repeats/transposase
MPRFKWFRSLYKLLKDLDWRVTIISFLLAYLALLIVDQTVIVLNGGKLCESPKCFRQAFISIVTLDNIEAYAIFFGASLYLCGSSDRRKKRQYEAWAIVTAAEDSFVSGGRISALKDLAEEGVNLSGLVLNGVYLAGINLARANLSGARFDGKSNLRSAVFDKAILNSASFEQAELMEASFVGAQLENAVFTGAESFKGNFDGAIAYEASFESTEMEGVTFQQASLGRANFTEANLWRADFTDANLSDALFTGADLHKAKFNRKKGNYSLQYKYSLSFLRLKIPITESIHKQLKKLGIISSDDTPERHLVKLIKDRFPINGQSLSKATFIGAKLIEAELIGANLKHTEFTIAFSRLVRYDSYLLLFPNILIMKPHSIAFRQKIIEVHEVEDISQRKLAKRFNVALSFIQKLLKQYRETDSLAPKVRTQQTPAKLNNEHLTVLRRLVEERNDATLEELRKQLIHETGIDVSRSTVDRALDKLGLTLKKRRSMLTRRKLSESSLSV